MSARDGRSTIFFIGNGGSAATASHMVNDLGAGLRRREIINFEVITNFVKVGPFNFKFRSLLAIIILDFNLELKVKVKVLLPLLKVANFHYFDFTSSLMFQITIVFFCVVIGLFKQCLT